MGSDQNSELYEALGESQRLGFLGGRSITDAVEHSRQFVRALSEIESSPGDRRRIVDLGSGGGLPGLVIANDRPDLMMTLIDRRTKRTDFLQRVVSRLQWTDRIEVIAADVSFLVQTRPAGFDVVVARGFAAPGKTLAVASKLLSPGGLAVVSDPPDGDRWSTDLLDELGFDRVEANERVACFRRLKHPT